MSYRLLKVYIQLLLAANFILCEIKDEDKQGEILDSQNDVHNSIEHNSLLKTGNHTSICRDLSKVTGMMVSGDCQLAFENAICNVSCELGFYLSDGQDPANRESITLTCESSGRWNQELQCVAQRNQRTAQDCAEHYKSGQKISGVYSVLPLGYEEPFDVFCDMNGGWTVFQRRGDFGNPEDYFFKTWAEYKAGFGNLRKEFWLGNDRISALTQQTANILRVDLTKMDGQRAHVTYNMFWVDKETNGYKLSVSGSYGRAGDSLTYHSGMRFFTKDKDNIHRCSSSYKGGWWYNDCHKSNLNSLNLKGTADTKKGIVWVSYTPANYSLFSEMKIKPSE